MTFLDGALLALGCAIFMGTATGVAYARARKKPLRDIALWAIIALFALVMLAGIASLGFSCESDRFRRCDLEGPNPFPKGCGLGHEHLC